VGQDGGPVRVEDVIELRQTAAAAAVHRPHALVLWTRRFVVASSSFGYGSARLTRAAPSSLLLFGVVALWCAWLVAPSSLFFFLLWRTCKLFLGGSRPYTGAAALCCHRRRVALSMKSKLRLLGAAADYCGHMGAT